MSKKLIVTEKPSVGMSIARALGVTNRCDGYHKTRDTYVDYRKAGYSKKFFETHREEITLHKAAKEAFDRLGVKKLPRIQELNAEYAQVLTGKKKAYAEYRAARADMQAYVKARKNVEQFFALEQEEEQRRQQEQNR